MGGGSRSCAEAAETLKACVRKTECYQSGQYTMRECLERTKECQDVYHAFVMCMRGQVDMRTRIQGNKAT